MKCRLLIVAALGFPMAAFATTFFASNNTGEIDLPTAFYRLHGNEQQALQRDVSKLLPPGQEEDLLGTYQAQNKQITADNTEALTVSKKLSQQQVFVLAKELANVLNQESVAVFIPSPQHTIGDTILAFKSRHYSINETIRLLKAKLPAQYTQAFSLHLTGGGDFDNAGVMEVEWLGGKINPGIIKRSFPREKITYHYGKAFLIYRDGRKERV